MPSGQSSNRCCRASRAASPRVEDRRVLNGIFWRLRIRFAVGRRSGTLWPLRRPATIASCGGGRPASGISFLKAVSEAYNGKIQMIDSSVVRVHQHAANGEKKVVEAVAWAVPAAGLRPRSTRSSMRCGLPIALKLTEGQAHDGKSAEGMLGALPRKCVLLADRGYDSDALRAEDRGPRCHRQHSPPGPSHRSARVQPARLQDAAISSNGSSTKSSIIALSQPASTKHDANYLASVKLAAFRIWMRFNELVT